MIKMDFETWEVVNRIHLANFKIQWQALLNTVMKDWMKIFGISWPPERLSASEAVCSLVLVVAVFMLAGL
jgi:hypothetical protein